MKTKRKKVATTVVALSLLVASCSSGSGTVGSGPGGDDSNNNEGGGKEVALTIESWRSDDLQIWQDKILPKFEKGHPNIKVEFSPSPPAEYDGNLAARLEGGNAGDLITCRPFDKSLALFDDGHLSSLSSLDGMDNFSEVAQSAWVTDDGKDPFCVPMASVIHGFMYNKTAFDELGLEEPETEEEFFEVLDTIEEDDTYTPLAIGLADQWESATVGFQNIGPNYWKGEEGRQELISGDQKLTDDAYVATFETLARWNDYIDPQASAITYSDAQNQFTFGTGAIYPSGSWEINEFEANADFELGVFKPPTPTGQSDCYISDHADIGIGVNAKSENAEEAKIFLEWVAGSEFASIYSNALPGFFSLQNEPVEVENELAQEFVSWRDECDSTIRSSFQILSRGEPNLEDELWATSSAVTNGELAPEAATKRLQEGLDSWYKP